MAEWKSERKMKEKPTNVRGSFPSPGRLIKLNKKLHVRLDWKGLPGTYNLAYCNIRKLRSNDRNTFFKFKTVIVGNNMKARSRTGKTSLKTS